MDMAQQLLHVAVAIRQAEVLELKTWFMMQEMIDLRLHYVVSVPKVQVPLILSVHGIINPI